MAVVANSPVVAPRITYLASGSGTFTGDGTAQNIANFTVDNFGNKTLIFEVSIYKTLGAAQFKLGLANAAAGTAPTQASIGTGSATNSSYGQVIIRKDPNSTNALITNITVDSAAVGAITQLGNSSDFVLNAAEVFYIVTNTAAAGNNGKYSYQAYLIG